MSDDYRRKQQRYLQAVGELRNRESRRLQAAEGGLLEFVRHFWHVVEPNRPLIEGWPLEAICLHLEAVTFGDINRLLINVPPGFMKSLLSNVFWPAWEWGPMGMPSNRFIAFSYGSHLTERDNARFRRLIKSLEYQALWGDKFALVKDGEVKVENDKTGWKFASSVTGVGTGERGDRVVLDDPHNAVEAESEPVRAKTVQFFRESMSSRLNDQKESAIVVIMQRLHDQDVSGIIIENYPDYVHLCIPAEYELGRHCTTRIGWTDPRSNDGELAWPERFDDEVLTEFKRQPFVWAGQYQQRPEPRGGGIIKRHHWQYYTPETQARFGVKPLHPSLIAKGRDALQFPPFEYIVAGLDSAYTEKEENDPSGFSVWGVFYESPQYDTTYRQMMGGRPHLMLIMAWRKWLPLHGDIIEKDPRESEAAYIRRAQPEWGLSEWVAHECRRWNVDRLLIEGKASGLSVAQEVRRLYGDESFGVQIVNPKDDTPGQRGGADKMARLWSVQHLFTDGVIWVPCGNAYADDPTKAPLWMPKDFAQLLIDEMAIYPRGYKDITDSAVYCLKHLRKADYALRKQEYDIHEVERRMLKKKMDPLYQV